MKEVYLKSHYKAFKGLLFLIEGLCVFYLDLSFSYQNYSAPYVQWQYRQIISY